MVVQVQAEDKSTFLAHLQSQGHSTVLLKCKLKNTALLLHVHHGYVP